MRRLLPSRNRRRGERGFLTLWMLGLCICLFFLGGISLDLWRGFSERRELAAMTDAAAVAGASQVDLAAFKADSKNPKLDPNLARQRAIEYMQNESARSRLELTDLNVVADGETVQVLAGTETDTTLMKILRPGGKIPVQVQSAAQPELND